MKESGDRELKDAVVYSMWSWETFNVPERIALALAHLGARVLYCEHPASMLRNQTSGTTSEAEAGITIFRPKFLADKLNRVPLARDLQAHFLANQICRKSKQLHLRSPIFLYPWMGPQICLLSFLRDKFTLVHVQMDFGEPNVEEYVDASEVTLVIPRSVYHQQRGRFGEKIQLIPQAVDLRDFEAGNTSEQAVPEMDSIPRPRLGYLGPAFDRINKPMLEELLRRHPDWHFISVDREKVLPLPNVHAVPWKSKRELARYAAEFDIGFMPYDCFRGHNLHCVPLKLFEYFALGLPVVSTPIIELWDSKDLVYLGDTAADLENAICRALAEPEDSLKRTRRRQIAKNHSVEALAATLSRVLELN